ncbi:MAG: DegV family protein [Chloroflexota bacterium]
MMSKIAIIADSNTSLSFETAAQHDIRQVAIPVHFGEQSFETGIDINDSTLFERIDQIGKLPTTAAPPPGKFVEAYQAAFDDGADEVICLTVSAEVSATYAAALNAAKMLPERKITVVDSRSLSMGQGFQALAAAEAAKAGASTEEILAIAADVETRVHFYAALSTLKYLAMSGRVGHLAAGMASILNIKPILTIRDGKLDMLEKVRTKKKSWARAVELAALALGDKSVERMAIVNVAVPEDAVAFEALLRESMSCPDEIMHTDLSAGLSVHSGAGLVGVGFVVGK